MWKYCKAQCFCQMGFTCPVHLFGGTHILLFHLVGDRSGQQRGTVITESVSEAFIGWLVPSFCLLVSMFFSQPQDHTGLLKVTVGRIYFSCSRFKFSLLLFFYVVDDLLRSCLTVSMSSLFSRFFSHFNKNAASAYHSRTLFCLYAIGTGLWWGHAILVWRWQDLLPYTAFELHYFSLVNIHFSEPITFPHELPIQTHLSIQHKGQSRFVRKKCLRFTLIKAL